METKKNIYKIFMLAGGVMMVSSALLVMSTTLYLENIQLVTTIRQWAPWFLLIGSILYVVVQRLTSVRTKDIAIGRLQRIQLLSGFCLIISSLLLIEQYNGFLMPVIVSDINSYYNYLRIVHNNWVVMLFVGAIFQLYTTNRLSHEQQKDS